MIKKRLADAVECHDINSKRWRSLVAAGRMAYEVGEFRQAESLLARALDLAKDLPERTFAINATEIGTAAIWVAEGRAKEAEESLRKSINTLEGESKDSLQELLAVALRFHAQALVDQGDGKTAESELKRSASILANLGDNAALQLAYTLCDLCGLYLSEGRISAAEQNILEALQLISVTVGSESAAYTRAGMIYKLCLPMKDEEMLDTTADGIMQMEYFYGDKHPNIARALGRYLKMLKERGDTVRLDEAKQRFGISLVGQK